MSDYKSEFSRLNTAQKEAVQAIDGPLLVVAGPGTGKTQLLSTRVAYILQNSDSDAKNILCLTFTNKAAINMKDRILGIAGPAANNVSVKTFHSFAAEVMNTYTDNFWNGAELSVAPDSTQLEIVESILEELPFSNPLALKFTGQFTMTADVQKAINLAKDAGLTPNKLKAIAEANLAYIGTIEQDLADILSQRLNYKKLPELSKSISKLPEQEIEEVVYPLRSLSTVIKESLEQAVALDGGTNKATNTSEWKKRWVQTIDKSQGMHKEIQRNKWWLEIANVYEQYRERIHSRGYYDYADMLVEVLSEIEQNPELRSDLQERFNYIMIDEFQDTNPAQLRLAHLVADHHSANDRPNIMAVGDDDQSIFKFNGAELSNMLSFRTHYRNCRTIVLTENYRSSQAVLDTSHKIIEQADDRLVNKDPSLDKTLHAASEVKAGMIRADLYSNRESQYSHVARIIKKQYLPSSTMAVLARSHDSLIKISGILHKLNVPIHYEQQSNILDHEIVRQLYLMSRLIIAINAGDKSDVNSLIHQIIRHPLWAIPPEQLWKLAQVNMKSPDWMESLTNSNDSRLRSIGSWFLWLAQQNTAQPLAVTIEYMLGLRSSKDFTSPLRNFYLNSKDKTNDYFRGLSAIQLLRSLVNEFSSQSQPSVNDLVDFFELNINNNKIIADESPFVSGAHAVQLMTVHKAKGLEFDTVFILDCIEKGWQPRQGNRKPPANLPLQRAGETESDYARLMYVAFTRAKSNIYASSYKFDHAGKDVATSHLLISTLDIHENPDNLDMLIETLEENLNWPRLSTGNERDILLTKLEGYSLSVTHLLNFLDIKKGGPQYFKERNLLNLPEAKQSHLSYGTAIHGALEHGQRLANKDKFNLLDIIEKFDEILSSEQISKSEYRRYKEKGHDTLKRVFGDYKYTLIPGSMPEQDLRDVQLGSAKIRGKLDRIDKAENTLTIIDYKTGGVLTSFNTKNKTQVEKAWRNKIQLIFYAILAKHSSRISEHKNVSGEMVYVEAESSKDLRLAYTPSEEEIHELEQLIEIVYAKIKDLDLPDTSKYSPDFEGMMRFKDDLLVKGKV